MISLCHSVGYRGQRYEVRATVIDTKKEIVIGWTNETGGGSLVEAVKKHPGWKCPRVIDLKPSNDGRNLQCH